MIIELLMDLFFLVYSNLLVFDIPDLPEGVHEYIDMAFDYIVAGGGVLANYVPLAYLMTLFGVLLAVDAGILIYHLVIWVLRKIPAAGVS